jgi:hypothetical protein
LSAVVAERLEIVGFEWDRPTRQEKRALKESFSLAVWDWMKINTRVATTFRSTKSMLQPSTVHAWMVFSHWVTVNEYIYT